MKPWIRMVGLGARVFSRLDSCRIQGRLYLLVITNLFSVFLKLTRRIQYNMMPCRPPLPCTPIAKRKHTLSVLIKLSCFH